VWLHVDVWKATSDIDGNAKTVKSDKSLFTTVACRLVVNVDAVPFQLRQRMDGVALSELQHTPGWTDLDIFKITYDEYMAFSSQYMAGQVALNPLSQAPNSYASSTDPVTLFTTSIKQEPKDFPVIKSLKPVG
jgi:hypothetical protein